MTVTAPAYVFDMDGALLTLEIDIEEVRLRLVALFQPWGVTRPFRPILGRIPEAAREASARGGDGAALLRAGLDILDAEELRGAASARARDGARQVLQALASAGARLGLLTHRGRAALGPALAAAGLDPGLFAATVTRDDAAPKPAHAGLAAVLERLVGPEDEAWYVASHVADLEGGRAARDAGWPRLRLAAVGALPALRSAGAERVVADLRELLPATPAPGR